MSFWSCQIDWAKTASAHADSPGPWRTAQALTLAIDGPPLYLACRRGRLTCILVSTFLITALTHIPTYLPRYLDTGVRAGHGDKVVPSSPPLRRAPFPN